MSGNESRRKSSIKEDRPSVAIKSVKRTPVVQDHGTFQDNQYSSSHYNKIVSDPLKFKVSSHQDESKVNIIKGGFDHDDDLSSQPLFINNNNNNNNHNVTLGSQKRESFLSQSLRNASYSMKGFKRSGSIPPGSAISEVDTNNGSFVTANNNINTLSSSRLASPRPSMTVDTEHPDPATLDIISRHLIGDSDVGSVNETLQETETDSGSFINNEEFDSLQLQGGDVTREIYNWRRDHTSRTPRKVKSFNTISRTGSFSSISNSNHNNNLQTLNTGIPDYNSISEPDFNVSEILIPGGFRRSFIAQKHANQGKIEDIKPPFFTRNFIEFLTLYGHFAGEEFSDDEDEDEDDEERIENESALVFDRESFLETDRLLQDSRKYKYAAPQEAKVSNFKAVLLLLKAFIGTGILFLPKGFYNGGLIFCICTLMFFSILSYWCFLLLIDTRIKSRVDSFGDIGKKYFGETMRISILTSIVLAQIGFAAAYIVFVAQNLRSVLIALTGSDVSISVLIFAQLVIFVPLSLTRKIAKLSGTALIADFFILLGIIYIYYNCTLEIVENNFKQIEFFNPNDWTIFIGTAVFTYEGIGLLIPIQKTMEQPQKFTGCLGGVMMGITLIFISIGAICYLAYGDKVQTVILNNFPQDNKSVNIIQLLYSLAILLSTPLQLFPAIRILENGIFGRKSGKSNLKIKWKKNFFRIFLIIITSLVAWVGNSDLDKFVAIIGSMACVPLIYIYPPLLHIKSYSEEMKTGNAFSEDRNYWLNNDTAFYGNMAVTVFGVILMIYTSTDALKSWIH